LALKDLLKRAVAELIERKRGESDFATRAASALEEIDREAAARRQAIQSLFGTDQPGDEAEAPTRARGRRGGDATS
jgi:hypothetical protein